MFYRFCLTFFTLTLFSTISMADPFETEDRTIQKPDENKVITEEIAYTQSSIKNSFEYSADLIFSFTDRCSMSMMQHMPMHPMQARPITVKLCSCLMDQFRADFSAEAFRRGGVNLAKAMSPQYTEICKALAFPNGRM